MLRKVLAVFLGVGIAYLFYTLNKTGVNTVVYPLTAGILILLYFTTSIRQKSSKDNEKVDQLLKQIYEQNETLNRLSVEREIALLLGSEQDYQNILDKSLKLVSELLMEYGVSSISLLKTFSTGDLRHLKSYGGSMPFIIDDRVKSLLDPVRITEVADSDSITLITPLSYDKQVIGYFIAKAGINSYGQKFAALKKLETLKEHLQELSKILSLTLKSEGLYMESIEDPLTGLSSKRYFSKQIETFHELARRHMERLSLIMIDIDNFKKINDTYGHLAGDIVLKNVAEVLKKSTRKKGDVAYNAYRYGGEELAVLLPKTSLEGAHKVAERIRKSVEQLDVQVTDSVKIKCTCSVGVAEVDLYDETHESLIRKADDALYEAKKTGKNRVIVADTLVKK